MSLTEVLIWTSSSTCPWCCNVCKSPSSERHQRGMEFKASSLYTTVSRTGSIFSQNRFVHIKFISFADSFCKLLDLQKNVGYCSLPINYKWGIDMPLVHEKVQSWGCFSLVSSSSWHVLRASLGFSTAPAMFSYSAADVWWKLLWLSGLKVAHVDIQLAWRALVEPFNELVF